MTSAAGTAALRALVEPLAGEAGYDLEAVEVRPAGRRRLVRVVVDKDGGVDLDGVAALSQRVGAALEDADVLGAGPYVLEVTSPGVDRPLTEPRHWRRAVGRLVSVPVDGTPTTARVAAADGDGVVLDVGAQRRSLPWDRLGPGRVQVEFARADGVPDLAEGALPWTST